MKKIFNISMLTLVALALMVQGVLAQTIARDRVAVAPFAQVLPGGAAAGGFYTFLAFTHPSLSTAVSQIGLTVSLEGATAAEVVGGSSANFTVAAGETHKVFIVATNHPVINPTTNSGAFTARDHFITTTSSGAVDGNVRILASNSTPTADDGSGRFDNLNQISMWGVIFSESTNAGFAMEFIGDLHDSTIPATNITLGPVDGTTTGGGRGIN